MFCIVIVAFKKGRTGLTCRCVWLVMTWILMHSPKHKFTFSPDGQELYLRWCIVWIFRGLLPPAASMVKHKMGQGEAVSSCLWKWSPQIGRAVWEELVLSPLLHCLVCKWVGHLQFIKPSLCRGVFSGERLQDLTAGVGDIHPPYSPQGALQGGMFPATA